MRKIIYFLCLIGSGVFVSFYGGNIPYLFFYFTLAIPVLTLAYSLYVYFGFKISQTVARTVTKAQQVPYRLVMANEDLLPFTNITLHYYTDKVVMDTGENLPSLSLLPHQKVQVDTKMYCKYRGTYPVGVKSVTVTDFLGLFTITYPILSQIRLTAMPRILPLDALRAELEKKDPKNSLFSTAKSQNLPDYELRPYQPGDPVKYIHWKNSAKAGELLVRKLMPEEQSETVLFMDLSPIAGNSDARFAAEDLIIEVCLAFAHDYFVKKIPIRILYAQQDTTDTLLDARSGFDPFYTTCANLTFTARIPITVIWRQYAAQTVRRRTSIIITHHPSDELLLCLEEERLAGNDATIIFTEDLSL